MKTRKWVPILAGAAIFLVFVGIGAGLVSLSWMREHVVVEDASSTNAESAFQDIHERFASKAPMLTMDGRTVSERNMPAPDAPRTSLKTLHVLAWDPREEKLARIELPFWLLRLKETPIKFSAYATGLDDLGVALTASDLERYGAGIVLDVVHDRERALLWVE